MKRYVTVILLSLAALCVVGGVLWFSDRGTASEEKASASFPHKSLIELGAPQRRSFSIRRRWFGRTESKETIRVVALEAARITALEVSDETRVRKGVLLFILGGPRIRSELKAMETRIASLRERVVLAERQVAMIREGVAEKVVKKEDLLSVKAVLSGLRSDLATAEQEGISFQSRLQVRAGVSGVFTRRRVSVGQDVEQGETLAEVIPPLSVRIVATLFPQEDTSLEGLEARVGTTYGETVSGAVTRVLPQRSAEGATVVWIEGDEVGRHFAPGETVSGDIVVSIHQGALAVPAAAVIRDQEERSFVFVKTSQGYIKRPVETGGVSDGWVEIVDGVRETEKVVFRGAYEVYYRDFNKMYKAED